MSLPLTANCKDQGIQYAHNTMYGEIEDLLQNVQTHDMEVHGYMEEILKSSQRT
jgi:hypothetical protein